MTRLKIRHMTPADLPGMDALRAQRGRRETRADWECALQLSPTGSLVAERDGESIAFAATIAYGASVGWICNIVVATAADKAIESVMLDHCIEILRARGVRTIEMDTDVHDAQRLKDRGFKTRYQLLKCAAERIQPASTLKQFRAASCADLNAMAVLDAEFFGVNREAVFKFLLEHGATAIVSESNAQIDGFGFVRPASSGSHLGPVIARDSNTQRQIADALCSRGSPIACDLFSNAATRNWISQNRDLVITQGMYRMSLGEEFHSHRASRSFANAGAFFG